MPPNLYVAYQNWLVEIWLQVYEFHYFWNKNMVSVKYIPVCWLVCLFDRQWIYLIWYSKGRIYKQWKVIVNLFSPPWLPCPPPWSQRGFFFFLPVFVCLSREILCLYKLYIHTLLFHINNSILCTLFCTCFIHQIS